ncbi:VCBS repeat-containing protein [Candidatus Bipolaricaulota bacterium]|nr:VCBS repeat-containing protein [Candidatus Bipolaricaulota bacterium]
MKRIASVFCVVVAAATAASCQDNAPALSFIQGGGYGHAGTFQVVLGDVDGDGDLDAVFANMSGGCELWTNGGDGRFTNAHQSLGFAGHGIGIGDLDNDGDLDLLITRASSAQASSVYFNDGAGRFSLAGELDDRSRAGNFVSLFDLEGDGDLDAGIYYADRCNIVYLNNGAGRFEPQAARIPGMAFWGDVDRDGDVDAVVERHGGGYATWFNMGGEGPFEQGRPIAVSTPFLPGSAELADVDADGDLDLIAASGSFSIETPITVLLNDGAGAFAYAPDDRFLVTAGRLSVGDFNGDGAPDALVRCLARPDRIGLNDGHGGFIDFGGRFGADELDGVAGIGDLDGDGDVDVFTAQYDPPGPNEVWLNSAE